MKASVVIQMEQPSNGTLPDLPGIYILHMHLPGEQRLRVGKLGEFTFPQGEYLYTGSARGMGGLKGRVGRHLQGGQRCHWHIDWLRGITQVAGCFYMVTNKPLECSWSQYMLGTPGAGVPAPGFGASDCRREGLNCAAHLIWMPPGLDVNLILDSLPVDPDSRVVYKNFSQYKLPDHWDIE